jgi:hypothetical protein
MFMPLKPKSMRCKNSRLLLMLLFFAMTLNAQEAPDDWPEITRLNKPWTRWWWMGSAVDEKNLTYLLTEFQKAGLGGVEIAPIYGVQGNDKNDLDFLSPEWMGMLRHTIKTADSLGMGVDLTLGTGWPYGGPQVSGGHAATKLVVDEMYLAKKKSIQQKLIPLNPKDREHANLQYVLAFGDHKGYVDLTKKVKNGILKWKAKDDGYTLYVVYEGKTGQKVKRAAPGGSGFTVDHYSKTALDAYLIPFDGNLRSLAQKPRAVFNDSYEVYGADFTPGFFEAFKTRRGYDLRTRFNLLMDSTGSKPGRRVKSDYRETLGDLLLEDFNWPWTQWAHKNGMYSRLQAHGSPGNLIDVYGAADIPESETFGSMPYNMPGFRRFPENIREGDADPVMLKFSSSAAHISGKPLVSSETFTWLREHFKTALSQCKPEVEDLFLNGVNHVFLHGSTYSPKEAIWPGWKFYASVNFNPDNTIWKDAPQLFQYIARCQSFLQAGKADNEILLYWPVYDVWNKTLKNSLFFQFNIHSLDDWLKDTSFYRMSGKLSKEGWSVDFVSDRFLQEAIVENGAIKMRRGTYKSLVVPKCKMMPLSTLKKLVTLKNAGGNILFEGLPESVPGFYEFEKRNMELDSLIKENDLDSRMFYDIPKKLRELQVLPEELTATGLKFIRREIKGQKLYYLVNHTSNLIDTLLPLNAHFESATLYDPLSGAIGKAQTKKDAAGNTSVRIQMASGQSLVVKTGEHTQSPWEYFLPADERIVLAGNWKLTFLEGGPSVPSDITLKTLKSWTEIDKVSSDFSGTARYTLEFNLENAGYNAWLLDLGDVRESARVWLNGEYIGTAWSVPFTLIAKNLHKGSNTLELEVTNLSANRIRAKELRGEEWKIFKEINMVNKDYQPLKAATWKPVPSGLLGEVTLTPLMIEQ